MAGILSGIRVIELGTAITAPMSGMILGDLGADVIKVERPGGDTFRRSGGGTYSPTFVAYNRNKRGIVLDLATDAGREHLANLIETADILVDNFRPGVLNRMGLDAARLEALNPRLIHCSVTGFGGKGPKRDRPAYDSVGQAASGLASLFLDRADPRVTGPTISDNVSALYATSGILAALIERQRTGRGRRVEVNMLEASMAFASDAFLNYTRSGVAPLPRSRASRSQCFALTASDDVIVMVHLSTDEKHWARLNALLGADRLDGDQRFATLVSRVENYEALEAALRPLFLRRPSAEWLAGLAEHDIPAERVATLDVVLADPQVAALGTVLEQVHPVEGVVRSIQPPILFDGERPQSANRPAPTVGEHTDEVLAALASTQDTKA